MLQTHKIYKILMVAFMALVHINVLNAQTADLTSLNAGVTNMPVSTTISWHTATPATSANEITAGNPLTDATAVPPGATYYMAFKDGTNSCYSPTVAVPVLTNSCPTTTADLTSLSGTATNNPGSGGTISFHTSAVASSGNLVASASTAATGTYYAAFFDSTNSCYSDNTTPVMVVTTSCVQVMITQVYHSATQGTVIEVTNLDPVPTTASSIILALYSNTSGDQTGVTPNATYTITGVLTAGQSALIKSSGASATTIQSPVDETNAGITAFAGGDDILILSTSTGSTAWANRLDVIESFTDNTSYVRIDETTGTNATYTAAEWVAFVDDALDPYRVLASGGPERHPHDPLLSEVNTPNAEANNGLGLHRVNLTTRTGAAWSNGFPDRSRSVVVSENYNHTGSSLSARKLAVNSNSKLAITNNLAVVTNDITLTATDDEIRLVGTSQLVQTHTGATQITGAGKLLAEQNPTTASLYRYNYMSSPVNTIGGTTYTVEDVLKDGTTPLDATSAIGTVAKDITFLSGVYDGDTTDPISLAEHWIYSYAPAADGRSSWVQELGAGTIPQTDGFIFKGPGVAQNYTFVGTPKDGDLAASTLAGDESYLVGNPFSSSLSVKKFIEDNLNSTTATLYFWQHAGEEDTSTTDTAGHNYAGYIGGYAARNIAMGLSANDPSLVGAFDITLRAEDATIVGSTTLDGADTVVIMDSATNNSVEFPSIIKGVDVLKINYKSAVDKSVTITVDGTQRGVYTLPAAASYATFDITMCIETNSDVIIASSDTNTAYLNYIQLQDADGNISCQPSTAGGSYTAPEPYVPIGQGFFVQGDADGGSIVFNNSQREFKTEGAGNAIFFRGENKTETTTERQGSILPTLKLGMDFINEEGTSIHRQFGISFDENNSFGFDKGYDSEIYDLGTTDVYWKLPGDELNYVIVGVQEIADDLEIPFDIIMGYDGSVVLQIDEIKAIERDLFIKDNLTNQTYLLNDNATVALQLAEGTYTDRFSLTFTAAVLSVDGVNEGLNKDLSIFMDNTSKELVIHNLANVTINKVELFNIIGQKINEWNTFEETVENRLKTKNLLNQIYIVNIQTDKGNLSKKIVHKK